MPLNAIHVTTNSAVAAGATRLDRPASLALSDDTHDYRIYALSEPLQPGDTLRLDFTVHVGRRGFATDGVDDVVTPKVTFLRNGLLPAIGYQPGRELSNPGQRRDHGLPAQPRRLSPDDTTVRWALAKVGAGRDRIMVESTIGTSATQRAVAPGALRRTWTERGRRYFEYATDRPIPNEFAIFSADYAVRAGRWRDVEIEVVHHPGHAWNADRMVASIRASLEHLSATLGPYPYKQLRLVEHPGSGTLHAFPINVSYEEGFALQNPSKDQRGVDFAFGIVAHELAHQWWGIQLLPAPAEGAGLG